MFNYCYIISRIINVTISILSVPLGPTIRPSTKVINTKVVMNPTNSQTLQFRSTLQFGSIDIMTTRRMFSINSTWVLKTRDWYNKRFGGKHGFAGDFTSISSHITCPIAPVTFSDTGFQQSARAPWAYRCPQRFVSQAGGRSIVLFPWPAGALGLTTYL